MENETKIPTEYKEILKWKRIYRETLSAAFVASVYKVLPNERIIIGHSLGDGYYFYFDNDKVITDDELDKIRLALKKLVDNNTKIEHISYPYEKAIEILEKRHLNDAVSLVKTNSWENVNFYKIDDYLGLEHATTMFSTLSPLKVWEIKKYKAGILLRYPRQENLSVIGKWKDNPELFKTFDDYAKNGRILNLYGVGRLNEIIRSGNIADFVEISEALQRRKIIEITEEIHKRKSVKYVFVAGPSSSNKTTFATKLCLNLKSFGYDPIQISLDDYYFTKDKVPRNELGEVDLECLEAIDTNLFREQLNDLYEGKDVFLPHFEFNWHGIGRRTFDTKPIHLNGNNILVIEGLHALNSELSRGVDPKIIFKIYISALTVLNIDEHNRVRTTDNRIIRRLVRDSRSRNAHASETLSMWDNVERGEKKYIFPFQNDVDAVMNSAHDYELSVLRVYAEPLLKEISPLDKENYPTAKRLLSILSLFDPLDSRIVPSDSMLREFIG